MSCYQPFKAWHMEGKVLFQEPRASPWAAPREITLPCGKCLGCRYDRVKQWALRCYLESSLHGENCFITLTYKDSPGSLVKNHLQDFWKRLRYYVNQENEGSRIRYFACGEYGPAHGRPHYHALIFGWSPHDLRLFGRSGKGQSMYRSALLERAWTFGYSSVGSATFEAAAYVAGYINKKLLGGSSADKDEFYSGKIPEFVVMSRMPGIASDWFRQFKTDVYPKDFITVKGVRYKVPRYFDKQFFEKASDLDIRRAEVDFFNEIKARRIERAELAQKSFTQDRLEVIGESRKLSFSRHLRSFEEGVESVLDV